jgi:hypothetical protein
MNKLNEIKNSPRLIIKLPKDTPRERIIAYYKLGYRVQLVQRDGTIVTFDELQDIV